MSDQTPNEESRWVVAPGAIRVEVTAGEGAEISSETREAIERLVAAVSGSDVEAFSMERCPPVMSLACGMSHCAPVAAATACLQYLTCNIKPS